MEERLKSLMQDLGNAINESLSDSERIAEAIGEIKRAGYDVFLVLEATIGFNKREADEAENQKLTSKDMPPGFARIPVDEAMKIIVSKGFPALPAPPAEKKK